MHKARMYSSSFLLKLPPGMLADLRKAATERQVTPTQFIRDALAKALGRGQ